MTQVNEDDMIEIVIHSPSQHVEDDNERMNESKWRCNGLFMKVIGGLSLIAVIACATFCYQLKKESRRLHSDAEGEEWVLKGTGRCEFDCVKCTDNVGKTRSNEEMSTAITQNKKMKIIEWFGHSSNSLVKFCIWHYPKDTFYFRYEKCFFRINPWMEIAEQSFLSEVAAAGYVRDKVDFFPLHSNDALNADDGNLSEIQNARLAEERKEEERLQREKEEERLRKERKEERLQKEKERMRREEEERKQRLADQEREEEAKEAQLRQEETRLAEEERGEEERMQREADKIRDAKLADQEREKEERGKLRQDAASAAVALRWTKLDKRNTHGTCVANAVYAILHSDRYFADFQHHKFPIMLRKAEEKKGETERIPLEQALIDWGNSFLIDKSLNDIWTKTYHALKQLNEALQKARESEKTGNLDKTTIPVDISKNLNDEQWKTWLAHFPGWELFNIPGYHRWIQYVHDSTEGLSASYCFMHVQILIKALYHMAYESDDQFEEEFPFIYFDFSGIPGTMAPHPIEGKKFYSRFYSEEYSWTDFPTEFNRVMDANPNIPSIFLSNPFLQGYDIVQSSKYI